MSGTADGLAVPHSTAPLAAQCFAQFDLRLPTEDGVVCIWFSETRDQPGVIRIDFEDLRQGGPRAMIRLSPLQAREIVTALDAFAARVDLGAHARRLDALDAARAAGASEERPTL